MSYFNFGHVTGIVGWGLLNPLIKKGITALDDQSLQKNNPYRRVATSALAGGITSLAISPLKTFAGQVQQFKSENSSHPYIEAAKSIKENPAEFIRSVKATESFYPAFLVAGAMAAGKEAYNAYSRRANDQETGLID